MTDPLHTAEQTKERDRECVDCGAAFHTAKDSDLQRCPVCYFANLAAERMLANEALQSTLTDLQARITQLEKEHEGEQILLAAMAGEPVAQYRGYSVINLAKLIADRAAAAERKLAESESKLTSRVGWLEAENGMLRGAHCLVDGDGPCGVCIKCLRLRAEQAESSLAGMRAERDEALLRLMNRMLTDEPLKLPESTSASGGRNADTD